MPPLSNQSPPAPETTGPRTPWLAAGLLLAGLGTVMLGPVLPVVAHNWHLTDQDSGLLIGAKFAGAFLGGMTVPRRLRFGLLLGTLLSAFGFMAFGFAGGLTLGCLTLFIAGLGIGLIIASTNIIAGRRFARHTGSALSSLNFFFSFGAVVCGVLAAALLPRYGIAGPLSGLAVLLLVIGSGGLLQPAPAAPSVTGETATPIANRTLLFFSLLLFLYGGLETCLSAWLTTYTLRLGGTHLLGGQSAVVLLWTALTFGRVIASAAMRVLSESAVQRLALLLTTLFAAVLLFVRSPLLLSVDTLLLGLALAPFFPSTFGIFMRQRPSARQAGINLAVSGLGAALFPWTMGVISTHSGSLRLAMLVPLALSTALLLLVSAARSNESVTNP